MVFAPIRLVAVGARVLCIAVPGFIMASQVFRVSETGITFGTLVSVGFVFVVCDLVVAVDGSVSHDRMDGCLGRPMKMLT
jgi:hypothetical protein